MSMTDDQIRQAIVDRLMAIRGTCNSTHITHNEGVFRGLIWALTGKDPGTYLLEDTKALLGLASIPCLVNDDGTIEVLRWSN
jgi:hypothetical protein